MIYAHHRVIAIVVVVLALGWIAPRSTCAQNVVSIDAAAAVPPPRPVAAKLGSSRNPSGQVIGVNSQYLTLDGKPWLPVMGEFHYSRYPAAEWEAEILKMKAAGVQIVSTYVIWIHQEQTEGVFDWSGQRDLRRFVQLCAKHGMYVYPRIGPWAHAETRNGGLPDWVLKNSPVRQNNPVYLKEVQSFYQQIAQQLQGLLWKDGGPVIGIQIENEYGAKGPGKGDEHIRTLKNMAVADGLDVPLYTVTGWDGAAVPLDAVLPVYGGYPAAPWSGSARKLPPADVYAFRFANRAQGSMGAIGGSGQSAASIYRGTPFLTAEVGAGIEDTYFRRPVLDANDVAAVVPVMLGSGANLLGYYMFHGGRNPEGGAITLQESQRTGYPTDVPVRSYDFQAPLGEFGQERESVRRLKLFNYFLNDFGALLAPMAPREPDRVPSDPADLSVPRVAARTLGDRGFVFLNNYVRGVQMPARPGFQIALKLPSGVLRIPERPIDLPSGAYGMWPVNFALPGATLRYSTAQLFKRVEAGSNTNPQIYFFFAALPGVAPEFVFDPGARIIGVSGLVRRQTSAAGIRVQASGAAEAEIRLEHGVHLVLLPEPEAEGVWCGGDPSLLLSTPAAAFSDGGRWTLQSIGNPRIAFGVFGGRTASAAACLGVAAEGGVKLTREAGHGVFAMYAATLPALTLQPQVTQIRGASPRPPWQYGPRLSWRPTAIPLGPDDADFAEDAAVWRLSLPAIPPSAPVCDVLLEVEYQGDAARLYRGGRLIDDNFWNGLPWSIGLRETAEPWRDVHRDLQLQILPLPRTFPMYIEKAAELHFNGSGFADALSDVRLVPEYQLVLDIPGRR